MLLEHCVNCSVAVEIIKIIQLLTAMTISEYCPSLCRLLEIMFVHWHSVTLMMMGKLRFVTIYT